MKTSAAGVKLSTINAALDWATKQFQHCPQLDHSSTHRLDAELLLSRCLHKPRSYLRSWPEQNLSTEQQAQFEQAVSRRERGEPIAYLLAQREFWDLDLRVTPDTLIPRPETELLVEIALDLIPDNQAWSIADLGTGSGAIALALAKHRPRCRIIAVDNSRAALTIAQHNAQHNKISNIEFLLSNWFAQIPTQHFQMIVSNPPYIAQDDPHLTRGDVAFEPRSALAAGPEGLDDLQHIIVASRDFLAAGAYLLLEHGYDQASAVGGLFAQAKWENIACIQDLSGQDRVTRGQKPTT